MKHLFRLLTVVTLLVIGNFSVNAVTYYHNDYEIGDFVYRLYYFYNAQHAEYDDHVFVVSAAPDVKLKGDVIVPESVEILGEPRRVTGALDYAFSGQDEMTSLTLLNYEGENIVWEGSSFGHGVFQDCFSLQHVEIPPVVTYISDWFKGCTSLEEVIIRGLNTVAEISVTPLPIPYDTFADCPIKKFSFNRNISISDFEEGQCILPEVNLENIIIGEQVEYIPSGLYTGRTDLSSYTVPDNIKRIGKSAFKDCTNLAEINLRNVTEIQENAFNNCPLSETLTIPGSVIYMDRCFQNCSNVRRLVMEPYIGDSNESVKNDGDIFSGTPIESAYIDREFKNSFSRYIPFPLMKSVEFGPAVTTLQSGLIAESPIEEIILGEGMKTLDSSSVPKCLTKLVIPAQIEEISGYAISGMKELQELIFEDGEKPLNIGRAINPNYASENIILGASVKLSKIYIGRDIFYDRYVSAVSPELVSNQQLYSPFRDLGHPIRVMVGPGVTHMDPDMFYDKKYSGLTSVDRIAMPEGITLNGGYPYMKCIYPRDAIINDGVIFDSEYTKLYWVDVDYEGEIKLPDTVREIGSVAMRNCRKTSIDCIPPNLEKIGDYAFDFSGVTFDNIVFPESMKEIGIGSFASCNVDNVTINAGLEIIGQSALTSPNTVVYNARHAVLKRNGNDKEAVFLPKTITFGEEVEAIPAFLLYNAWNEKVTLPQGLKEIGEYAFGNSHLTELTIPGNVETIGTGAFEECYWLKNITFEKGTSPLSVPGGPIFGKKVKPLRVSIGRDVTNQYGSPAQIYSNAPTTLYVGPDVKNLYPYSNLRPYKAIWNTAVLPSGANNYNLGTLANYTRTDNLLSNAPGCVTLRYLASMFEQGGIYYVLTSPTEAMAIDCSYSSEDKNVDIPAQVEGPRGEVTVAGMLPYTFSGNTVLEQITLGFDGSIEQNAFQGCSSLKSFCSTGSLSSVGTGAFNACQALETVEFLGRVESLAPSAFAYLPQLNSVYFTELREVGTNAFAGDSALLDVELSDSVKRIGSHAFYDCSSLDRIWLPGALEEIGSHVFHGCRSLKEIELEANVTTIPDHAFNGCSALEAIVVPEHIEEIKASAFTGCTSLKELDIQPRTMPLQFNSYENGRAPFNDSPIQAIRLGGEVSYPAGHSPFSNLSFLRTVTVEDDVTLLPEGIFSGCFNLENIELGKGIETIGANALEGCEHLTTLYTPAKLATIGAGAFRNCSSLQEVRLGASVSSVGANAFDGANGLETLYSDAQEPPVCDADALEGIDKFMCELHVPTPSVEKYQHSPQWEDFFTIKGTDVATDIEGPEASSVAIAAIDGGVRVKGLGGKGIIITSLDGASSTTRTLTDNDQFIPLSSGCWIITIDGNSQSYIIK